MMNEEKKISQYGDVPNISVRANGRRMWTPEEDKKLMLAATGANKMKALSEELWQGMSHKPGRKPKTAA